MSHSKLDKVLCRLCVCVLAFASPVGIAGAAGSPPPSLPLEPCTLPQLARAARCGSLEVPEDPAQPSGRRISIAVAVIPAATGEAAISAASIFAAEFAPLLRDRDLLLLDQRGTGRSNALDCDLFAGEDPAAALRDLFPPRAAEHCAKHLRARADLTQYT
jgi:hypothetical protein